MKLEKLWIIGLLMLVSINVAFAQNTTDCRIYTTKETCQNVTAGSPCVWCLPNGPCEISYSTCPDFDLYLDPYYQTIQQYRTATFTVTINNRLENDETFTIGKSHSADLSCYLVNSLFVPDGVNKTTNMNCSSGKVGTYQIYINATGDGKYHSNSVTLNVVQSTSSTTSTSTTIFTTVPIENSCNDTDDGFTPTVKGTVSGFQNYTWYSYTDSCLDTTYLKEYSCVSTSWTASNYNCKNTSSNHVCNAGRCVSTTSSTTIPTTIQTTTTIRRGGSGCGRNCLMLGLSSDSQLYMIIAVIVIVILAAIFFVFKLYAKKI